MSALIYPNKPRLLNDTICDRIEELLAVQAWFEVEFLVLRRTARNSSGDRVLLAELVRYSQVFGTIHPFGELTVNCFGKLTNSWWNTVHHPMCEPASQGRIWVMADECQLLGSWW
jgi:hypothetical protein